MSDTSDVLRVCVTGAAGQIGYSLVFQLAQGCVFGAHRPITLHLLDIAPCMSVLQGVVMELRDCALPALHDVIVTADPLVAFDNVDFAFLVGAMPRREGMERKDLLACNVKIFKTQGEALDRVAKKSVKVLVVGNPANTNALVCSHFAPSIPVQNFSAMTRLDVNRSQAVLADKLGVSVDRVRNCIIWGNHSSTQVPDISHALVLPPSGGTEQPQSARSLVDDEHWCRETFFTHVQTRGARVIEARKLSSAMSAAKAACDHMRDWWQGLAQEEHFTCMAVMCDGAYGAPPGVMFSLPVHITAQGEWRVVTGLEVDDFVRAKMELTARELVQEREEALKICGELDN